MIQITHEQFETLIRRENPEVFTSEQMSSWIESQKEVLLKSEVSELNDIEKSQVDEFNQEFKSFVKVTVITTPSDENLSKGLQYTDFFIRERQVEWKEVDNIIKSVDGGEDTIKKSREGIYTNTALNQKLGRVGAKYGQHRAKEDEGDSGESKRSKEAAINSIGVTLEKEIGWLAKRQQYIENGSYPENEYDSQEEFDDDVKRTEGKIEDLKSKLKKFKNK